MSAADQQNQFPNEVEGGFTERIAERMGENIHATTVFAQPVHSDGVTVIPVARARMGFGGGSGNQPTGEKGTGGGGGLVVKPVGYIELRKGHSTFHRISSQRMIVPILLLTTALLLWNSRRRRLIELD